jgi:hypothetical protein
MGHYLFNFTRKNAAKGRRLRDQATELAELKLWGIGEDAPNRAALAPGDRVLLYVGAPEKEFIGHAVLASESHQWTPEEADRYPSAMTSGVAFSEVDIWPHPLSIRTAMPGLDLEKTNPNALFFSGVTKITQRDFEAVFTAGTGAAASQPVPALRVELVSPVEPPSPVNADLLFKTAERLKRVSEPPSLSEYDTRAEFIDKYLEALGYTELGDIQRGAAVDSGTFPDYVLVVNEKGVVAIEAKKLGAQLGQKEAGQVASYCTNLGLRWGAVTDGGVFKLYDMAVISALPEERMVFSRDLSDYRDRDDFETRIYPDLALIAKTELASGGTQLERRVALEAVRELLSSSTSKTIKALRKELDDTRKIRLSASELSELASDLLG